MFIGFLFTYIAPLAFVLLVTMMKEAVDDFRRYQRDKDLNNTMYEVIREQDFNMQPIRSADMKVGQIVKVKQN